MSNTLIGRMLCAVLVAAPLLLLGLSPSAHAVAYGSINNFDAVNDNNVPCHGFEIEIDGAHTTDVTYTYDWNHYGVPKITGDTSDPLVPKVFVRYESGKNPDGSWAAYTAVPSGPIAPTDGHQFTNPSVNFGGEHFGAGFYGNPAGVKYFWLIDDGAGHLVHGTAVNISTPTFTYFPPVNAAPPQVQAVIVPPPPPAPPPKEFGEACWVKETRTSAHNNNKVELRDLVSDDPANPNDKNWMNGEPAEVEVEWQIMQTDFNAANGGANGEVAGAPEDLANGDEVITRRYDFFKYIGPLDPDTGEALADTVGPDGIHGVLDYANTVVVGDYIGAQMAGFDAQGKIGLIDHLQDGEINVPYVDRTIVVGGTPPIITTRNGVLPDGMTFDEVTGILSGTPTVTGAFSFTIHSTDANAGDVTATYTLTINDTGVVPPVHIHVTTSGEPPAGGGTTGDGDYEVGANVSVAAAPNLGWAFVNWTDGGTIVSTSVNYDFVADVNRELVAHFVPTYTVTTAAVPPEGGSTSGDGTFNSGDNVTVTATPNLGYAFLNWAVANTIVSANAIYTFPAAANADLIANFELANYTISTSASPNEGGGTSGGGTFHYGNNVTVVATANPGYNFVNWIENGAEVSASASYSFSASGSRNLVANFARIKYTINTSASPTEGGGTSGGGVVNSGDSVTVVAAANAGYSFVNWTEGGAEASASSSYTFTASANRDLVANFARITYTIGTSASPAAGGGTSGGGVVNSGDNVTVVAAANAGYSFVNWTEGGAEVSTSASYTFTASGNRSLVANFARITYTIATSASPAAGGGTSGGVIVNSGDSVTVVAAANAGYNFVNWTEGGSAVSTSASYTFTASGNRSLVANFVRITYTVNTSASPAAGGGTSGGGVVNSGDSVTVVAATNAGYNFVSWTEGGAEVSASASYTFAANGNRNLVANFVPVPTTGTIQYLWMFSPVIGGLKTVGIVALTAPAPAGGTTISLSSSNSSALQVPAYAFVPAGSRTAFFVASTRPVKTMTVKVTATLGTSQKTSSVKVLGF